MKTMAEVLVAHQRHNLRSCLCGWDALGKSHPEHQEAMLTAAGFGDVREARESAWDEGRECGVTFPYGKRGLGSDDNPYRAAAVRGEG